MKLPAGHGVQEAAPSSAKEPGWQTAHTLARLPEKVPLEQVVQVLALVSENDPARHPLQATAPLALAKLPAVHDPQTRDETAPDIVENVPGSQFWHVLEVWAPWRVEYFPAEQDWHVRLVIAPVPVEYVPAWQSAHWPELLAPLMDWYVPDWHDWQVLEALEAMAVE
jgi:hypothetical protein